MPYYYGYGFGIDPLYLLVVLVCTVLGLAAQSYINSTYKTWSKVRSDGDTGARVARRMLDANGCNAVGIKGVAGELTDHYNPQDNNLYLSEANRSGGSVASVAVACHEAGHAAQRQSGYAMMKVRTALVPVVNFTQNTWTIVLLMGLFMNIAGLTTLALIFFSAALSYGSLQQKLQPITNWVAGRRGDLCPRGAVLCVGLEFAQGRSPCAR